MKNKTKKSLIASILSMILCLSMLLGTTLAWFTDTAVNTNNRVKAGTLDVKLLKFDGIEYVDISEGSGNIFNDGTVKDADATVKSVAKATLWEPNKTEVVFLKVENDGNLALDYSILLTVASLGYGVQLENAMHYAIISDFNAKDYYEDGFTSPEEILTKLQKTSWEDILALKSSHKVETGVLPSGRVKAAPNGSLLKGESDYFALAVHMDEQAGNEYQNLTIDIDVNVEAQQKVYESDSFGNTYDAAATKKNLLTSSSFEEMETGDITTTTSPWQVLASNKGIAQIIDTTAQSGVVTAYDGDKYAYTSIETGNISSFRQVVKGFIAGPGAEYTLSAWVYRESESVYPRLNLSYRPETDQALVETFEDIPVGEWTKIEATGTIPQGTYTINTYCGLVLSDGATIDDSCKIYWDDVQLTLNTQDDAAARWNEMLAAEEAVSQYIPPTTWRDPLIPGENLLGKERSSFIVGENGTDDIEKLENIGWIPFTYTQMYANAAALTDGYEKGEGQALRLVKKPDNDTSKSQVLWQTTRIEMPEDSWGDEYQLSYYYRANDTTGKTRVWAAVYFWTDEHAEGGSESNAYIDQVQVGPTTLAIRDGAWHQTNGTFVIPENTKYIEILPRIQNADAEENGAYVDFDEFVLYKTCEGGTSELPYNSNGTFTLDTDGTFFYNDMEQTTFAMSMSEAAKNNPQYANGSVKFAVYDGADVVWGSQTASFTEGVASVAFDLSKMVKINVPYCVKATVYDESGNELWVKTKEIFMFEALEYIDEEGQFVKFGEDFNPVIGYHLYGTEDMARARDEAGVNVIQIPYQVSAENALKWLDDCAALGIKGLLCLYYQMASPASSGNLGYTIDILSDPRIQNHEALFGYVSVDEPFTVLGLPAREELINSYRLIRQYDQKNLIWHTENTTNYDESTELADICFPNVYGEAKAATVYQRIVAAKAANTAAGRQKPLWALLMSFDWNNKLGYWIYGDDVRNNNWQALIAGAETVGYFSISDAGSVETSGTVDETKYPDGRIAIWEMEYGEDTTAGAEMWASMCEFSNVEKEIAYDHFKRNEGSKLIEDINIENGGYIAYSWADKDGQVYVVLLNVKGADNTVSVALKDADGNAMSNYTATVIAGRDTATENVTYTRADGNLSVNMTGVEALLLKVTAN